jgi:hypothetical protein
MKSIYFTLSFIVLLVLHAIGIDTYFLIYVLLIIILFQILTKFGKGIVLLELIMFFGTVIYLLSAILGYEVYNRSSELAVIWAKVMPVPKEQYFNFFFPALVAFFLGLSFHLSANDPPDTGQFLINKVKEIKKVLQGDTSTGIALSMLGIGGFFVGKIASFGYLGTLLYFVLFPGILYLYFSPNKRVKYFYLGLDFLFLIFDAYQTGMFTVLTYMGAVLFSIFLAGTKISGGRKLLLLVAAIVTIFLIQIIKGQVRRNIGMGVQSLANQYGRDDSKDEGKIAILTEYGFFPMYARIAQGQLTSKVMRIFPDQKPFSNGEVVGQSILASFVPRIVWPDKPESGGKFNMKYYLNFNLRGYSINIGPPGEAYANFGLTGGIIFMFFFGYFIRLVYLAFFNVSKTNCLYMLWLPVIFFQVLYCLENDVMQALNSAVKGSLFVYGMSKLFPAFFKIDQS